MPRRHPALKLINSYLSIALVTVAGWLPFDVSCRLGQVCGRLALRLIPRMRHDGLAGLDFAYGDELSLTEKMGLLRKAAESLGMVGAEFAWLPQLKEGRLQERITVEGAEHIDRSRGAMVIGAHLGNWEWMAPLLRMQGFSKVAEVVRPMDEPRLNAFVDRLRRSAGIGTIPKEGSGGEVLRLLRDGWIVGVLVDQSPRKSGVPVRFFNSPCWATIAPVMAAVRGRAPIHPMCLSRGPDGHYLFEILPAVPIERTGHLVQDLIDNSQRVQDIIERFVRRHPDQWLWFHRRWKPRPRLAKEWQARMRRYQESNHDQEPEEDQSPEPVED